jgi:hypothetical protein
MCTTSLRKIVLTSVKLFFGMNVLYKDNMDGLFATNYFALVATPGALRIL